MSDDGDQVIDTSDTDERDVLHAQLSNAAYWQQAVSDFRARAQQRTSTPPRSPQSSPLALTPSPSPHPYPQNHDPTLALIHANDTDRRYTMRQRRPQQLHPYIHDQMLYKRQMRSNPEAIVKFGFGGGGRRSREREMDGALGEEETQEWRMDVDGEPDEEDSTWVDRRSSAHSRRSKSADPHPNPNPIPTWLPEALQNLLSTDEEDESDVRDLLREARKVKERARRREREEKQREEEGNEKLGGDEGERKRKKRVRPFPIRKERERKEGDENTVRSPNLIPPRSHTPPLPPTPSHYPKSNSPPISIHSTPPRSQTFNDSDIADGGYDQGPEYDYGEDDGVCGHTPDDVGDMDFNFESPRPNSQYRLSPTGKHMTSNSKSKSPSRNISPISSDSNTDTDTTSTSNEMTSKDRKRLKALQRMMPAAMARQLVQQAQQQKSKARRQRSATATDDGDQDGSAEEGPLMPGKARVRIGMRKGDAEIKGHTESEDSDAPLPDLHSDSDVEVVRHKKPRKVDDGAFTHVTYISDGVIEEESSDGSSSSSDDEVDDAKIGAWLGDRPRPDATGQPRRLKDESLVDWMLTRTRTVGGQDKTGERKKKTKSKSTKRVGEHQGHSAGHPGRLHLVTAGAQKERQTLLSFDKQPPTAKRSSKSTGGGHRSHPPAKWSTPTEEDMDTYDDDDNGCDEDPEPVVNKHWIDSATMTMKQKQQATKKKLLKQRRKPQVYVFTSKGTHITSGRRRIESAITIDVEDEGFHQALAPDGVHRPHPRRKAKPKPMGDHEYQDAAPMDVPMDIEVNYEPPSRRRELQTSLEHRRDIKVDFEIHFLPSGLAFQPHTYIGKGWLHELVTLVSGSDNVVVPSSYSAHGIELSPVSTSASDLAASLVSIGDGLLNFVFGSAEDHTAENVRHWEGIIRTACQLLSWLPANSNVEECTLLSNALQEQLLGLITQIDDREDAFSSDGTPLNGMVLTIYWFAIESLVRFSCSVQKSQAELLFDTKNLIKYISLLARRLHTYGMQRVLEPVLAGPDGLDSSLIPGRTAELWVCLFHLISNCHVPTTNDSNLAQHHPFWRIIQLTLQQDDGSPHTGLEASETTWRTIFSICALSQFSVHGMTTSTCRLPASWELVAFALKQIRLSADPETDKTLSERILDKRDEYIWLIASRCFILCNRWHWRIDDASMMFNQLASIFRSRKFANLRREASDFPSFMLENDLQLLKQYKPSDTAFELFLKLIVQALNDCHPDDETNAHRIVSSKLKKLLALAVPVGSVPFKKSTPPTAHELSMLYNRLSAVAVAIYLESSPVSVEQRLIHARRYVNFEDADNTTRVACIRGMMHFAIIMRYRRLPLDNVLSWLAEMTDILVDEYQNIDASSNKTNGIPPSNIAKHRAVFSIQMLLGSVRRIIETSNIDPTQPQKQYPEPALLNGPWVTRIFAKSTNLTHVGKTGLEIRRLVQAFLDARQAAMPAPQRHPAVVPRGDQESQESQEDYGIFDLDLDDPELQAALGSDGECSIANQNRAKDELVWQVIDGHITPAIFRLVCKYFNDPSDAVSFEEYCQDADKWIDCWVGCAHVLVQLGKRNWGAFLELGPMSWAKIIDGSWRRRVGLRFMFTLLQFDPEAYTTRNDVFIEVLLESMAAAKVTMENEYIALVFSIDGLRHPLLRHIPCQRSVENSDYVISVPEFFTLRLPTVDTIFSNLADSLRKETHGKANVLQNQIYIGHVVTMLSAMQDVCEQMSEGSDGRTIYTAFCRNIFTSLQRHPELKTQQRLGAAVAWGKSLEAT